MIDWQRDPASLRDGHGTVYWHHGRVFRSVSTSISKPYESVLAHPLFSSLMRENLLWPAKRCVIKDIMMADQSIAFLLEHPILPFVSYPYEWCFSMLKDAALFHLSLHARLLQEGLTLRDASAYNVQFLGSKPVFIDHLSMTPYPLGQLWIGHRQFCEEFLNPLLLQAKCSEPFNAWYRGTLRGVSPESLSHLLPWYQKLSFTVFFHVVLQAKLNKAVVPAEKISHISASAETIQRLLSQLQNYIQKLTYSLHKSSWTGYTETRMYSEHAIHAKKAFVADYVRGLQPQQLWDMGCHEGEFSALALQEGASFVVGFDSDPVAIETAYHLAKTKDLAFLPLCQNLVNPSVNLGWAESERKGLRARAKPAGLLALALIHHLCLAENIPLSEVIHYLLTLSPTGIIEFVPITDPMATQLTIRKERTFSEYTLENFKKIISQKAKLVREQILPDSERVLLWYEMP